MEHRCRAAARTWPFAGMLLPMPAIERENGLLDDTNRLLLAELQENARLSLAELGRRVGLSSPAVAERLQRLERAGVITGYRAMVDPRALGFTLNVVIRV